MSMVSPVHLVHQPVILSDLAPTLASAVPPPDTRGDHTTVDPEAHSPEEPPPLNLDELKANHGAVSQTMGVGRQTEEVVRSAQGQAPDGGPVSSVARNVGRASGPVSAVFGARDAVNGVQEMQEGKFVEGGLKAAQGTTSSASGAATAVKTWAPLVKESSALQGLAGVAGKVAGPLGAVGAGISSASDLKQGLEVGSQGIKVQDPEKVGTGTAKLASAGLMAAGLACPPAGLAGAALYAGTTIFENRQAIGKGLKKAGSLIGQGGGEGAELGSRGGDRVEKGVQKVGDTASKGVDAVKGLLG
ncbi:hypothetical protein DYH09_09845 [bacterium CPR1]|nr:hypothetical protein [bacterium CPR1]